MSISVLLLAAVAMDPTQIREVVENVAGSGKPNCIAYLADGAAGPCMPIVGISRERSINATSQGALLTFTLGAVTKLNSDEFALLAGHEIAHYYLGHMAQSLDHELAADRLGAELACRAGYDPSAGVSIFLKIEGGRSHPPAQQRRAAVLEVECLTGPG